MRAPHEGSYAHLSRPPPTFPLREAAAPKTDLSKSSRGRMNVGFRVQRRRNIHHRRDLYSCQSLPNHRVTGLGFDGPRRGSFTSCPTGKRVLNPSNGIWGKIAPHMHSWEP